MLSLYLLCLAFFVDGLSAWISENCTWFAVNSTRYWKLVCGVMGVIEEIKAPLTAVALSRKRKENHHQSASNRVILSAT